MSSLLPEICLRVFLTLGQTWPSNLVREKTVVLLVSDHRASLLELVCHGWNYMSLLSNIVHVLSTQHNLTLCSPRRLSFLFDSWWLILFPQLRFGLWSFEFSSSDQYDVLQIFHREQLVCPFIRTVSWSYKAKTVWSWTGVEQFWRVQSFQDHFRRHITCW